MSTMQVLTVMTCCTHPKRVLKPFIGCVLISHANCLAPKSCKGFLLQNFHILANHGILFTAYPAADAQFFTLVKLNETSGVVLANVCEVYACATTLLSFLWRKILTPRATVFSMSRCVVWGWLCAVEPKSNRSSVKWGFSCSEEPFKPRGLNINCSCARYYLHALVPHFYVYDNCQEA